MSYNWEWTEQEIAHNKRVNEFVRQFMEIPPLLKQHVPKQYLIQYGKVSASGITFLKGGMSAPPLLPLMYDERQIGFAKPIFEESGITCEELQLFREESRKIATCYLTTSFEVSKPTPAKWKATGKTMPIELGHIRYVEFAESSDWVPFGWKIGADRDGNYRLPL